MQPFIDTKSGFKDTVDYALRNTLQWAFIRNLFTTIQEETVESVASETVANSSRPRYDTKAYLCYMSCAGSKCRQQELFIRRQLLYQSSGSSAKMATVVIQSFIFCCLTGQFIFVYITPIYRLTFNLWLTLIITLLQQWLYRFPESVPIFENLQYMIEHIVFWLVWHRRIRFKMALQSLHGVSVFMQDLFNSQAPLQANTRSIDCLSPSFISCMGMISWDL